jgi:transposase
LKKADVENGARPGLNESERSELRALKKRTRLLEQENEILRRAAIYFAKDLSPK